MFSILGWLALGLIPLFLFILTFGSWFEHTYLKDGSLIPYIFMIATILVGYFWWSIKPFEVLVNY